MTTGEPIEVPAWLALTRLALQAATVLAILIYPRFSSEQRAKHADALAWLKQHLNEIRNSLPLLLKTTASLVQDAFSRLYGKPGRMIVVSVFLTLAYLALVALLNWNWIASTSDYIEEKLALDQSVDPHLKYAPDEIKKAMEVVIVGHREFATISPRWKGGIWDEIRDSFADRDRRWFEQLNGHQHRKEVAFLTLLRGYSWAPGPLWLPILSLLIFNVLFDLVVVVSVMACLSRLAEAKSIGATISYSVAIVGITAGAYAAFLVPTSYLIQGYNASYWLLFLGLPFAVMLAVGTAIGIINLLSGIFSPDSSSADDMSPLAAIVLLPVAWLVAAPIIREIVYLGWPPLEYPAGASAIPYALASCSVAPGLLAIAFLVLALGIRFAGGLIVAPLVGYLGFVLDTPRMTGFSMLVLPYASVELLYQAFEFLKAHPDFVTHLLW